MLGALPLSSCSQQRREAAGRLRAAVESVLSDLAMGGSQFDVRMSWTPLSSAASSSGLSGSSSSGGDLSGGSLALEEAAAAGCGEAAGRYRVRTSGLDTVDFLFAAGQGEPLRPLSAVASGGESARIMLALKAAPAFIGGTAAAAAAAEDDSEAAGGAAAGNSTAAAGQDAAAAAADAAAAGSSSQILVLDEIDSGIGSRLGQPVGRILRRMAAPSGGVSVGQILVVSHLPQVGLGACLASLHAALRVWALQCARLQWFGPDEHLAWRQSQSPLTLKPHQPCRRWQPTRSTTCACARPRALTSGCSHASTCLPSEGSGLQRSVPWQACRQRRWRSCLRRRASHKHCNAGCV